MYLKRVSYSNTETFGVLMEWRHAVPFAVTLEDPWLDNKKEVSCIPAGEYVCARVTSPRFGNTFEVTNVPGRTHILFHAGNTNKDTRGCILLGTSYGYIGETPAILNSTAAMNRFMDSVTDLQVFDLEID